MWPYENSRIFWLHHECPWYFNYGFVLSVLTHMGTSPWKWNCRISNLTICNRAGVFPLYILRLACFYIIHQKSTICVGQLLVIKWFWFKHNFFSKESHADPVRNRLNCRLRFWSDNLGKKRHAESITSYNWTVQFKPVCLPIYIFPHRYDITVTLQLLVDRPKSPIERESLTPVAPNPGSPFWITVFILTSVIHHFASYF